MKKLSICIAILVCALMACEKMLPKEPSPENVLAGPLEGLSPGQIRNHLKGDAEFARIFGMHDGLGPIYVAASCEGCHVGDGKGHPLTTLTRFNRFNGTFYDPMINDGGPQLQHRAIAGYIAEQIPTGATGSAMFLPPAVTGLGFLEAVPDSVLLALSDPGDVNGDGISGVPNYINPPPFFVPREWHVQSNGKYIGRFGRKAGAIDLLQQTAGAYINDIGITSDFFMQDLFNVQAGVQSGDNVPDPEVPASTVHNVVFYIRTLKAPPRRNTNDPDVATGENLFSSIGCASCHIPALQTGPSDVEALGNKTFFPYTDLLLHDMGSELNDGYTEGTAKPSEWKTTPLWGLGLAEDSQGGQHFLMHDGRAKSFREAIEFHGGEGAASRGNFRALSEEEKEKLIKFLKSL